MQFMGALAGLPLTALGLDVKDDFMCNDDVEKLGPSDPQLTSLTLLAKGYETPAVKQLAAVMRQLTSLSQLIVNDRGASASTAEWVHVCQAAAGLRTLQCLNMGVRGCLSGDNAVVVQDLASATQLKKLILTNCGGNRAFEDLLRAQLQRLMPDRSLHMVT